MKINKCPICEEIKKKKERLINNLQGKTYLCKKHLREALAINQEILNKINFEDKETCPLCKIEKELNSNDMDDIENLCLFHLYENKDRLKDEDWKILIKKWEEYRDYLKEIIKSYDYQSKKMKDENVELIFDLFFGTGRTIR